VNISREEIASTFGRHSVKVMEKSYLIPEKSTKALDFYNFVREVHDTTGFNENEEISNFSNQKKILAQIKKNKIAKRPSLELLSQNPPVIEDFPYRTEINSPLPLENTEMQNNEKENKENENCENNLDVLAENIKNQRILPFKRKQTNKISQMIQPPQKKICLSQQNNNITIHNNSASTLDLRAQILQQNSNLQKMMFEQNQAILRQNEAMLQQQAMLNEMFLKNLSRN